MKNSEIKELKDKSLPSLHNELDKSRERLSDLRFKLAVGKAKNVSKIRETKKKIARILTFIKEKQE